MFDYNNDIKMGGECTINDKDAYQYFKADLIDYRTKSSNLTTEYIKNTGLSDINLITQKENLNELELAFYVTATNEQNAVLNANMLINECKKCIIKFDIILGFEFACALLNHEIEKTGIDNILKVTLNFVYIRRFPLRSIVYSAPQTQLTININNNGACETGLRIKIKNNSTVLNSLTILGITITNILANAEFVIDGINGQILENGINAFNKTDIIDFPKLKSGDNSVIIQNKDFYTITFEFYPVFIF